MNDTDCLFSTAPVSGWDIASEHFVLEVDVWEAGKMNKRKDLSEFD